ncbi:MAG: metallophosphoesterase [Kofleriaceae bacterium]|nr:metallophosphoesterase [Kofleriaceae bacterium]
MIRYIALALLAMACTRPSEERAEAELTIGQASLADAFVEVEGGLAAVRELADHKLVLWSQAPDLRFTLDIRDTAAGEWTLVLRNALTDSVLVVDGGSPLTRDPDQRPTDAIFHVPLAAGVHQLRLAPLDADIVEPYTIVAMADIQTALPTVNEVFEQISAVPNARFVVAMGDITQRSEIAEYDQFDRQLDTLTIPFYTTLGNHELWAPFERFHERYGRASFHFEFKGVAYTFADTGDADIDPLTEQWIDGWLDDAIDKPHVFLTHIPPIDPVGIRYGGFRSEQDGRRLLARLVRGKVDLTLYGHIHTYVSFDNAGIPAFISGGGGADPMKWDGINRHFLIIEMDPASGTYRRVDVHRVD